MSLFIVSCSLFTLKPVKARPRFTFVLESTLSAQCFASLCFLFFAAVSFSAMSVILKGTQPLSFIYFEMSPVYHHWLGIKHPLPSKDVLTQPKHQNVGRGQSLCRTLSVYFSFRKMLPTLLLSNLHHFVDFSYSDILLFFWLLALCHT